MPPRPVADVIPQESPPGYLTGGFASSPRPGLPIARRIEAKCATITASPGDSEAMIGGIVSFTRGGEDGAHAVRAGLLRAHGPPPRSHRGGDPQGLPPAGPAMAS